MLNEIKFQMKPAYLSHLNFSHTCRKSKPFIFPIRNLRQDIVEKKPPFFRFAKAKQTVLSKPQAIHLTKCINRPLPDCARCPHVLPFWSLSMVHDKKKVYSKACGLIKAKKN